MTLPKLLQVLSAAEVNLSLRLITDAPAEVLTTEVRAALTEHKPALLVGVARELQWKALRDLRWGPGLEDPSPGIVFAPRSTPRERIAS